MYPWSNAIRRIHDTMRKQKDLFPCPSSCKDVELQAFWDLTLDQFEHYKYVLETGDFDAEESDCLEKRLADLEETLEEIDYEWSRRTWLH